MLQQRDFRPWVGGLVRGHIAVSVFSEEYFPCLSPTTGLVVVPEARLHILFTLRKRRKNEKIEAHSLHTSSLVDADLSRLVQCCISQMDCFWCLCLTIYYMVQEVGVVMVIVLDHVNCPL